ncbi:MAG: protein translocase subunit SecD [Gemmatimonadota bacterium]|nr:MAG: protein translocase subunit SecD [Gemmatimonadota bacterium]
MLSSIRNRLILIGVLMAISIFSLIPRDVTTRVRGADGAMKDTTIRRVPLKLGLDLQGGIHLALEIDESRGQVQDRAGAIDRALTVIRTRVDEFGVAEPLIQRVGTDRIVVELAGIDDPGRAKQIVQRSAFLEWRIVDMQDRFKDALPSIDGALTRAGVTAAPGAVAAVPSAVEQLLGVDSAEGDTTVAADSAAESTELADQPRPLSSHLFNGQIPGEFLVLEESYPYVDSLIRLEPAQRGIPRGFDLVWGMEPTSQGARTYRALYAVENRPIITGEVISDARATVDQVTRASVVQFTLNRSGGRILRRETGQHINDYMAIMLDGRVNRQPPIIRSQIYRNGQIELGGAPLREAEDLALVLRAGALPAPVVIVEERTVGPTLGRDSVEQGRRAAGVAAVVVLLIMAAYYRAAGLLAIAALIFYVLFTLGGLASLDATLTLPGLAGFVLSLGIAVDANVLIFERIREELKLSKTPRSAVDEGFQHAMPAIIDANITTIVTAAFLFQFGTGPVKGFAVTLIIGIIASLLTAVFVTRTFFLIWLQRRKAVEGLSI